MADDILFKIKTEGDTSGAEAVEESIKKVGEEVDDVNKKTEAAPAGDDETAARGKALAWAEKAEKVRGYAAAVREAAAGSDMLSNETKALVEKVGAATETAAGYFTEISAGFAAGGPIGAILAAAKKGVVDFIEAWAEAGDEIDKANTKSEESVDMWKRFQQLKIDLPIVEALETANQLLDEQLQKMTRNARVAESERALQQARQETAGADAVRSGSQSEQVAAANNLATAADNQVTAIRETLDNATKAQAALQSRAELLIKSGDAGILLEGFDKLEAQLAEGKTLQAKASAALEKLTDDRQIGENQIATIREKQEEQLKQLGDGVLDALTQSATRQRDALRAEVDRLGENASAGAKTTLAILDKILERDGIRADELAKYAEAQGRLNGMAEKSNAAVLAGFDASERLYNELVSKLQPMISRLGELELKTKSIRP